MWGWIDIKSEEGRGAGNRPGIRRKEGRSDAHRFVIPVQFTAVNVGAAF